MRWRKVKSFKKGIFFADFRDKLWASADKCRNGICGGGLEIHEECNSLLMLNTIRSVQSKESLLEMRRSLLLTLHCPNCSIGWTQQWQSRSCLSLMLQGYPTDDTVVRLWEGLTTNPPDLIFYPSPFSAPFCFIPQIPFILFSPCNNFFLARDLIRELETRP